MKYFFTTLFALLSFSLQAQCEYSENFDSYNTASIPTDWTIINTTGNNYVVASVQAIASAPSPTKFFQMNNSTALSGNLMAVLPVTPNLSDGNHRISFYLNRASGSATLQVGTIDTPTTSGAFSMISDINPTTTWTKYTVNIPAGTNQYIALRHTFGSNSNTLRIDNICIEQIPTCLEVSGITSTGATTNSLSFSWTGSASSETKWEYLALPPGSATPTSATSGTEVNTTSATTPNNLTSNTSYNIYVRAKCSGTNFGAWIGPLVATTTCGTYTAGFTSGFEESVSGAQVKPCWTAYDTGTGDLFTYGTSYSIVPFGNIMLCLYFSATTAANSLVLVSPEFSDISNNKQIRFKMNKRAGYEANMHFELGTVASPTNMSTFTPFNTATLTQTTVVAGQWTEFTVPLTSYNNTLGHHYIAFRPVYDSGTATQYIFMDDFVYEDLANLSTVETNKKSEFTIYPNPVKSELNIVSETPILKVSIYNMEGKKILTVEQKDIKKVNLTTIETGNYILQAVDNKGTTKNSKFIKQ